MLPALIARLVLLFLLYSCWNLSLRAQSTAELDGTITDSTGGAVPNAKVAARNQATGTAWNTQSNGAGLYVLPSLPPGNYQITVTSAGFQTLVVTDLRLDVATSVTKDLQLKVGSVSQQMEVTSEVPLIELALSRLP